MINSIIKLSTAIKLLLAITCLSVSSSLWADVCDLKSITTEPDKVKISLYPEKISKIDEVKNTFEITYYLLYEYNIPEVLGRDCHLTKKEIPGNIYNPYLEIMKSETDEYLSEFQIYLLESSLQVERKMRSTIINAFNFKAFPFDQQSFEVQIMALYPSETLTIDPIPIDSDSFTNMAVEGWSKKGTNNKKEKEAWDQVEYDKVIFSFDLKRKSLSIFIRIVLPILIIITLGWVTTLIPITEFETIIQLQSATLIALIAFNIIIEDKIPNLSYVTLTDIIITIGFLSNFLLIVTTIIRKKFKNSYT